MSEYIEREEAIRVLSNPIRKSMCVSIDEYKYRYRQRETDLELIKSLTAADVQPVVHGKWETEICDDGYGAYNLFVCSLCRSESAKRFNYCRECGAKMDGET